MKLTADTITARRAVDAIEWAAVDRENGFRHLRANTHNGHANGLFPVWNGVEINARREAKP